ncbi:prosaposin [Rhagoletis pomonella]|uniref:prosaposin n=1 Tax=Rhagoletis pomonella TaxID=28610 RepID=UPI0017801B34|nr:prosaposin [Rhagoletis pomonella]
MQRGFVCCVVIALLAGAFLANATPMLGAKQCTWGPSYWCKNLTNAKGCHAVRHCIQTVWETQNVPVDDDSICKICKDMVTQARDQLRSNETMEELKEVFEGSCNLIPVKIVRKECDKLADDFVPELVEALSSQMNPDQVCSVAGLCNNARIDELMASHYQAALDGTLKEDSAESKESKEIESKSSVPQQHLLTCGNCNHLGSLITEKFNQADRDEILENILHLCGEMSSFSDACSNIVLTYFNDIYDHMRQHLNAAGICHMSGSCAANYHKHADDPVEPEDPVALASTLGDDIPCKLCEQLVQHLRDVLIANTTETEFKQVLNGLCNQTKGFREECNSLVEQYYDVIYNALVNNLDANGACFMIGVCPKGNNDAFKGEIRPLLPSIEPAEIKVTLRKLGANEPKFTQEEIHAMTLPIDTLMGAANPGLLVDNGELCTFCEYLIHYIQVELSTPTTEDKIKEVVNNVCSRLGRTLRGECHNFIDMYGDAVIALLIQGLNPREICPKMAMCPPNHDNFDDVEIFAPETPKVAATPARPVDESDKPTCPLCLFAVAQAQQKIGDNKSKANIKNVLDHLCAHLPPKLQTECVDFVETYSNELVDKLIADFKPQEICVDIKLCATSSDELDELGISLEEKSREQGINEIDSNDSVDIAFGRIEPPNCLLCEEFIKIAEKKIGKRTSKQEIKKALDHSCDKLRLNVREKCHKYVAKYGDKIADLLVKEMAPKMICREIGLCIWSEQEDLDIDEALKYDVVVLPDQQISQHNDRFVGMDDIVKEPPTCVLCEFVMTKLEAELRNASTQEEIKHTVENICKIMPRTVTKSCNKFIDEYINTILSLIGTVPPKVMCQQMQLCFGGLDVVSDEVIECGVCHGATSALLPYFKQHLDHESIAEYYMLLEGCQALDAKYYDICNRMIRTYGQSILNLAQSGETDESSICAKIGKCFSGEKSSLAFAKVSA